jgi:hypothetical protein
MTGEYLFDSWYKEFSSISAKPLCVKIQSSYEERSKGGKNVIFKLETLSFLANDTEIFHASKPKFHAQTAKTKCNIYYALSFLLLLMLAFWPDVGLLMPCELTGGYQREILI